MVYVTQEQKGKNLVSATKYGEIKILLPSTMQVNFATEEVVYEMSKKLQHFNDDDYLLLIGDPATIGIATAIAAKANNGRVTLLKWDRQETLYYVVKMELIEFSNIVT